MSGDVFDRLCELLTREGARYRVVSHVAEGRSAEISRIRGNDPAQALKAMVVAGKGGGATVLALAIVPSDRRLDFDAIARALGTRRARLADADAAQLATGCAMGAVPPFVFGDALTLLADDSVREKAAGEVVFNAGRLDRSIFLHGTDYLRIAHPRFAPIAPPAGS